MWFAVIGTDASLIGLYTSRIDAALTAKRHSGSVVWSCQPNSDGGTRLTAAETTTE